MNNLHREWKTGMKLAHKFLSLPWHRRIWIMKEMGIGESIEGITEVEFNKEVVSRVQRAGKSDEFAERVRKEFEMLESSHPDFGE